MRIIWIKSIFYTLKMRFERTQIVGNTCTLIQQNLGLGGSISIATSFPQIGISMSVHPQSACHMVEAWAGAGSENNPRARAAVHRPHLVEIDRQNINANRYASTNKYGCSALKPNGKKADNKDEYPQALFKENGGAASVKCVSESDNKGSGKQVENQISGRRFYGSKDPSIYGYLENQDVIEMIVFP
jgi:hypothetical protein